MVFVILIYDEFLNKFSLHCYDVIYQFKARFSHNWPIIMVLFNNT